jgi:hypothetical protein
MNSRGYELEGWNFHQVEGKTYIGKAPEGWEAAQIEHDVRQAQSAVELAQHPVRLEPIYELAWIVVQTPQGPAQVPTLKPPFGCPSIRFLTLPRPGVWRAMASLDRAEAEAMATLIGRTIEAERQARAAAMNLTLAPANTPLPPMPQPRGNGRR